MRKHLMVTTQANVLYGSKFIWQYKFTFTDHVM